MSTSDPLLIISSDHPQFDPDQLQRYRDEGFRVHYIENADVRLFQRVAEEIEEGEGYGIIAFGAPALHALKFTGSPIARLRATIAYYPPAYLWPEGARDRGVSVVVHVAGAAGGLGGEGSGSGGAGGGGSREGVVVWGYGDDGWDGEGEGEAGWKVTPGFAEMARGKGVYNRRESEIAWRRDLDLLRWALAAGGSSGFGGSAVGASCIDVGMGPLGVELLWEEFLGWVFRGEGGGGKDFTCVDVRFGFSRGLRASSRDGSNTYPYPSGDTDPETYLGPRVLTQMRNSVAGARCKMKLLRRTVGVDSVVDEVVVRFRYGRGRRGLEWLGLGLGAQGGEGEAEGEEEGVGEGREDKVVVVGMVLLGAFKGRRVVGLRMVWDTGDVKRQVCAGGSAGSTGSTGGSNTDTKKRRAEEVVHLSL